MDNPITVPLPQNLPTDWTYGQTVAPNGADVGLATQYGYNYLMSQVNAAQQAAQECGENFENAAGIVVPSSAGNLAALSAAGDLQDSGKSPNDFAPAPLSSNLTLYVNASTGSDSNPGTQEQPFATIQAAINSVPKNLGGYSVAINIADGIYNENVTLYGFYGNGVLITPIIVLGTNNVQINGDVAIVCQCTVCLSVLSISGILRAWYSNLQLNRVSVSADNSGAAVEILHGTLWAYSGTISNPSGNGIRIGGTAYISNVDFNVNNIAIVVGNSGWSTPGLCICGVLNVIAGTNFQKVSGGAVIQNGALV